jgi:uncharacterized protein (DUF2236 family)
VAALTPRERSLYYEEMKALGAAYSIPGDAMPADYAAFRRYWASMLADGLRVTETTREVAGALLRPGLPRVAWPAIEAIRLVTVGTLPEHLRGELDLGWGPGRQRLLAASQLAIRRLLPALPALFRRFPQARSGLLRAA